ncbi:hypothetical protein F383_31919 [Gossypium arboreum]|uniref:Uncharacterized protein n=1 Tax=Gossypium arboreum TaxID=29729 RepID=A0A0B0PRL0_GOSAR|nr:hypothetical protein F383_21449 [Gossypium arboreum]KHG26041.1 hypothetical protein F383_31919 [Gossypium arboreum]
MRNDSVYDAFLVRLQTSKSCL